MNIQMIRIIFLFLGFTFVGVNAQEIDLIPSSVYDFNHFSFEFQTGFNRTQFLRKTGPEDFDDWIERVL